MVSMIPNTEETHGILLGKHMPDGRAWANKRNPASNMGKMVFALSVEFFRMELLLDNILTEMDVRQTSDLLLEWEESVGIPDPCFGVFETLEERRQAVINKLSNYAGVQTLADFQRVIDLFGVTGTIVNGNSVGVFPLRFPIRFFTNRSDAVHTLIVDLAQRRETFPFSEFFPIPFTSVINDVIICVLNTLKPANVRLLFRFTINS